MKKEVFELQAINKLLTEKVTMLKSTLENTVKNLKEFKAKSIKESVHIRPQEHFTVVEDLIPGSKSKVFECDQCECTFKRKKNLQKHVNSNHLIKSAVQCSKCRACFDSKADLKNHMIKKHSKSKSMQSEDNDNTNDDEIQAEDIEHDSDADILEPYSCMYCGQKFDEYEDFHDHLKQVHMFEW